MTSFHENGKVYLVDIHGGTCTCPLFERKHRPDAEATGLHPKCCKHIKAAREFAWRRALPAPRLNGGGE